MKFLNLFVSQKDLMPLGSEWKVRPGEAAKTNQYVTTTYIKIQGYAEQNGMVFRIFYYCMESPTCTPRVYWLSPRELHQLYSRLDRTPLLKTWFTNRKDFFYGLLLGGFFSLLLLVG